MGEAGSYAWAEVFTRDPAKADGFLSKVFPYGVQQMDPGEDPEMAGMDFKVFSVGGGGNPVLGRMKMDDDFPPDVPPYIQVYFGVPDCDEAVSKTQKHGGSCTSARWTARSGGSRRSRTRRAPLSR